MLNQLDTLIGFAVVMALVSLLVTIITQMISSLLGMRGKCLADALEVLIYKIDSSISPAARAELVHGVLTHPAISDSVLSMQKSFLLFPCWKPDWWQPLTKRWKRATAIRPDEMLAILEEYAGPNAPANSSLKTTAQQILSKLNVVSAQNKEALQALRNALPKRAEEMGPAVIQELNAAANHSLNNLETWFNSAQDRAQQWFTMHARVVTVIASCVVALVLQLDAIALFRQVSSDKKLLRSLVTSAQQPAFYNTGAGGLTNQNGGALRINGALYDTNMVVLSNALNSVMQTASQNGLQLLPDPYPIQYRGLKWPAFHSIATWNWPRHLFGVALTAALLSLGAPFWFNLLKSMASLRSSLANQVDNNPKQSTNTP